MLHIHQPSERVQMPYIVVNNLCQSFELQPCWVLFICFLTFLILSVKCLWKLLAYFSSGLVGFFLELEEFLHLMEASLLSDKFCRIFSPRLIFLFILLVVTSNEQKFLILIKSSLSVVNGYHIFLSGNIKRNNQLENSFAVSLKLSIHLLYDQVFPLLGIYSRE